MLITISDNKNIKVDIPTMDFPFADHPQLKYPLDQYSAENAAAEQRSLEQVRSIIKERKDQGRPVAGLIIEPIQSEGGDRSASDEFYRTLRQICLDEQVKIKTDVNIRDLEVTFFYFEDSESLVSIFILGLFHL